MMHDRGPKQGGQPFRLQVCLLFARSQRDVSKELRAPTFAHPLICRTIDSVLLTGGVFVRMSYVGARDKSDQWRRGTAALEDFAFRRDERGECDCSGWD